MRYSILYDLSIYCTLIKKSKLAHRRFARFISQLIHRLDNMIWLDSTYRDFLNLQPELELKLQSEADIST